MQLSDRDKSGFVSHLQLGLHGTGRHAAKASPSRLCTPSRKGGRGKQEVLQSQPWLKCALTVHGVSFGFPPRSER